MRGLVKTDEDPKQKYLDVLLRCPHHPLTTFLVEDIDSSRDRSWVNIDDVASSLDPKVIKMDSIPEYAEKEQFRHIEVHRLQNAMKHRLEEHISEHPENALDQHEASDVQANQSPAMQERVSKHPEIALGQHEVPDMRANESPTVFQFNVVPMGGFSDPMP